MKSGDQGLDVSDFVRGLYDQREEIKVDHSKHNWEKFEEEKILPNTPKIRPGSSFSVRNTNKLEAAPVPRHVRHSNFTPVHSRKKKKFKKTPLSGIKEKPLEESKERIHESDDSSFNDSLQIQNSISQYPKFQQKICGKLDKFNANQRLKSH